MMPSLVVVDKSQQSRMNRKAREGGNIPGLRGRLESVRSLRRPDADNGTLTS